MASEMLNKAIFFGRLTGDPKMYTTKSGKKMAMFSLAYNYGYGEKRETFFVRLQAFGRKAEIIEQYCVKGTQIIAECMVRPGKREVNGQTIYDVDFWVQSLELLGSKLQQANAWTQPLPGSENATLPGMGNTQTDANGFLKVPDGVEDELPFA